MINIKNATPADIEVIQTLANQTWWPAYSPILEKEQIEYMLNTIYSRDTMLNSMENGSQKYLLLYNDHQPMAFASYGPWAEEADRTWKIHKLYVLPETHGKGFGKQLIEEISSRARELGITSLVLNVNRQNPAFHFYRKVNFTVIREEDIPIGPYWMNDYVMRLNL